MQRYRILATLAIALNLATGANAQDQTADDTETARLTAQAALYNAQAAATNAKAARDNAKIDALGLPSFENKTTISDKGGEIEAAMLVAQAVKVAGSKIKGARTDKVIILTGSERLDFNAPKLLKWELEGISNEMNRAIDGATTLCTKRPASLAVPFVTALISAAGNLLSSESTITGLDGSIDDLMLANAVASSFGGNAQIYTFGMGAIDLKNNQLALDLVAERGNRNKINECKSHAGKDPEDPIKSELAALDSAAKRFDDFYIKVTKINDSGRSMITDAALLDKLIDDSRKLLFLKVHKAGGSLINTKNIATTFGLDPVKVSGGLVISYAYVDPKDGKVESADILSCRTNLTSLRKVQSRSWTVAGSDKNETEKADCF